jgi:hypothetical protein
LGAEYLKNKISVNNSERHNVVEKIFGSAGVLDANDTFEFEERSDFLLSDLNMYKHICIDFANAFSSSLPISIACDKK